MNNTFYKDVRGFYDCIAWFPLREPKSKLRLWSSRLVLVSLLMFHFAMTYLRITDYRDELGPYVMIPSICMVLLAWIQNRKGLNEVIDSMAKIDRLLETHPAPGHKRTAGAYRKALIIKFLGIALVRLVSDFFLYKEVKFAWYLVMLQRTRPIVYYTVVDLLFRKFTVFVHHMTTRSIKLRKAVIYSWTPVSHKFTTGDTKWQQNVISFMKAHDLLQESISQFNRVWNVGLVLAVVIVFSSLVGGTVHWCKCLKKKRVEIEVAFGTFTFYYVWLWNLYDMTSYTQECEEKVNQFRTTLYNLLMSRSKVESYSQEFRDALLTIIGRKKKTIFSVHGLHSLNYTLVHTIFAGVISTVIIILQSDT